MNYIDKYSYWCNNENLDKNEREELISIKDDENEMKEFGNASIARHKVPRYFLFVDEFPMNAAGKILKYKMRDQSAEILGLKK